MSLDPRSKRSADPEDLGRQLCPALFAASKLVSLYGLESQVALDGITGLQRVLNRIHAAFGFTSIRVASGTMFLNESRVRMDSEGFMAFQHIIDLMKRREIGEIRIGGGASEDEVGRFLQCIYDVPVDTEAPLDDLKGLMQDREVREIDVYPERDLSDGQEHARLGDLHESSVDHYLKGVFAFNLLLEMSIGAEKIDVRKCKRIVQGMVDIQERDPTMLLALTSLKGIGGFHASHAVNVAILTLAMARRLGMKRALLARIGLAAMLHDIGRHRAGTGSGGSDSGHERKAAHKLLGSMGFTEGGLRCVLGALHHHARFTGVEDDPDHSVPALAERLIAVADTFDGLTTPGQGDEPALSAHDALEAMGREGNGTFDPRVVALLAEVVGRHPRGTVVDLKSGATGVVCGPSSTEDAADRPRVRITETGTGKAPEAPTYVDLGERDESGAFVDDIARTSAPDDVFGSIHEFVAAL